MKKTFLILLIIIPFVVVAQDYRFKQEFYGGANKYLLDSSVSVNSDMEGGRNGVNFGTNVFMKTYKIFSVGLGLGYTTNNYNVIGNESHYTAKVTKSCFEIPIFFDYSYTFKNGFTPFLRTAIVLQYSFHSKVQVFDVKLPAYMQNMPPEYKQEYTSVYLEFCQLSYNYNKYYFPVSEMLWPTTVSIGFSQKIKSRFDFGFFCQINYIPFIGRSVINFNLFLQINYKKINKI